jgi:condensin complex subunit 1
LLETHPFGALHGGTLNLAEWQERYDQVSKELEKVDTIEMEKARRDAGVAESGDEGEEDPSKEVNGEEEDVDSQETVKNEDGTSTPGPKKSKRKPRISSADLAAVSAEQNSLDPALIQQLRLTKKYYSDALKFITQIENAVPTLCQLLVSTTKSEVLESMRFFRMAYEYNLAGAEVGIKTMLHLIWTKDNTGVGSGVGEAGPEGTAAGVDGRGIRAVLVESYKSLYFDVVPDLSAKQQVNRIAKNMIE